MPDTHRIIASSVPQLGATLFSVLQRTGAVCRGTTPVMLSSQYATDEFGRGNGSMQVHGLARSK